MSRRPSSSKGNRRRSGEIEPRVLDPNHIHYVQSVHLQDMAVGNICWLTEKRQVGDELIPCVTNHACNEVILRDNAYRHPIVIIGMKQRPGSSELGDIVAQFLLISSYKNEKVDEYIKLKTKIRKFVFLIPIRQAPERSSQNILREAFPKIGKSPFKIDETDSRLARCTFQLDLAPESQLLQSQSFVDPEHIWEMPVQYIKPYRFVGPYKAAYSFRISENSYNVLAVKSGVGPQPYPSLSQIKVADAETMAQQYLMATWAPHLFMWAPPIVYPTLGDHYMGDVQHGSNNWRHAIIYIQPKLPGGVEIPGIIDSQPAQNLSKNQGYRRLDPTASTFTPRSMSNVLAVQDPSSPFMSPNTYGNHGHSQNLAFPRPPHPPQVSWQYQSTHPIPSPTYQTSAANQEPVIPITPFLLRNNIGRVRAFIYKPGEDPITVKLTAIEDNWFTPD